MSMYEPITIKSLKKIQNVAHQHEHYVTPTSSKNNLSCFG